jgi:CheY-like chemotaxis protein
MADEPIILLVEDNPDDEALTVRALKKANVRNQIVVVRDGAEALDYLHGTGVLAGRDARLTPQVVLLDIKLPKIDGLEVLRTVKGDAALRTIPVVVLTSSAEESDLVRSYELGVNAYVVKPVEFHQFITAVKELGVFWGVINEPPPEGSDPIDSLLRKDL